MLLQMMYFIYLPVKLTRLIPVAAQSKTWVCGLWLTVIAGSNPAGGVDVSRECCASSGRGFSYGPITRPEESYGLWCFLKVIVLPR